jgi:hypothetical protein
LRAPTPALLMAYSFHARHTRSSHAINSSGPVCRPASRPHFSCPSRSAGMFSSVRRVYSHRHSGGQPSAARSTHTTMREWRNTGIACARPGEADLRGAGCGDHTRSSIARPYPVAAVGAADSVTVEVGAVHQRAIEPEHAGRVPRPAEAILRSAHVGARLFLRDDGAVDEATIKAYIESQEVGQRRSGSQDHSPTES